ncbi:sensor histidine kinase [Sneathiella glossodoripedis]|uniref:sensor histidine kinase n=1 Tax=Sneathiella glossodoripedis TaxID=418853 RepID=UPI00131ED93C|nr:HAMP domain-containing sensor histidine kinase [Sneathiella glossodoripedis]
MSIPAIFDGLLEANHVRQSYVIADVIRALGALIVLNGIIFWGKELLSQYQLIKKNNSLEERISRQSDLLAAQSRDIEIRTIDYLEQKEAAIEAERSKTNFLRNTSHEFRTPLNAIIGLSDLISEGKASTREEQREFARMISDSGRKLLKIIDTLLEIARIKSGEYIANPQPARVKDIIDQCTALLLPKAHAKSIRFEYGEDFPEYAEAVYDSNATHHILTKIIDNAITYSPENTVITIDVDQSDEDFTKIHISDEGPGIPQDQLKTVFEIFGRAEKWQHRGDAENTGLGLALALKMAEIQDGQLTIESDGSKGTTCILSLPAYRSANLKAS